MRVSGKAMSIAEDALDRAISHADGLDLSSESSKTELTYAVGYLHQACELARDLLAEARRDSE